jgi:hypothetical protein
MLSGFLNDFKIEYNDREFLPVMKKVRIYVVAQLAKSFVNSFIGTAC